MNNIEIVELPVGAGTLLLSPAPGRSGAFANDLDTIVALRPDLVVTLLEDHEIARTKASALPIELRAHRIGWRHFPIVDFGVPGEAATDVWAKSAPDLLARLDKGQRILIHCMGGCGRTGMIALRLMILFGEMPDAALARLRALRPCAIETDAQMNWARSGSGKG